MTRRLLRIHAAILGALALGLSACSATLARFPLREPMRVDTDLRDVSLPCRATPKPGDRGHLTCAPEVYESPLIWDGADKLVFEPLSSALAVESAGEAVNVNSLDEVPDSAWFTNRVGRDPLDERDLALGACTPAQLLDPETAAEGSWVVDKGKNGGSTLGFRVNVPGKGKYLFKADDSKQSERSSAASVIGAAVYHAAGFNTSCEQIVYFKPSLLKLRPGLRYRLNFGDEQDFDQRALDAVLASCPHNGGLVRMQASAWLPGYMLGPFRYEGTRADDPNDVVPHEDRRELRGGRLLAAWLDHVDAREANSMDEWIAARKDAPESSPGHVTHAYLDTSECLGPSWAWDELSRRMGYSYVFDWGTLASDFVTLGTRIRPWDTVRSAPGREVFAYFNVADFVAEQWKAEYANPAFSRMTERDGAWMARILARFTPAMVRQLARMARFSDPGNTAYLEAVLEGRLEKIAERYLTRLSPMADVAIEGGDRLCALDLAAHRGLRDPSRFRYTAHWDGPGDLRVTLGAAGRVCVTLPHRVGEGGPRDDAPARYVAVTIADGVAAGPLIAYLYDLGPMRGYRLAGLERAAP